MGFSKQVIVFLGLALLATQAVMACDPAITQDFGLTGNLTGANFTSTSYEPGKLPALPPPGGVEIVANFVAQFPGLSGLGISSLYFLIGQGGLVQPHIHPRASEIFFVISGLWNVGFIDTNNILYTYNLTQGDQFLFPQGLIHFQYVIVGPATGYSALTSQNPGLSLVETALFNSTPPVPEIVLYDTFHNACTTLPPYQPPFQQPY